LSIAFLVTTIIVVATPGTGVLYTLSAGLSRGARASIIAALGCTLGIVPHMLAAITGLAAVVHASALAFQGLKYAGAAYLLYLAWSTLRDKRGLVVADGVARRGAARVITTGVLINILNPKLTIFFFAFLPQFVSSAEPDAVVRMLELSGVFMLVTFVVFVGYGVFAASVRRHVIDRPRVLTWMRRGVRRVLRGPGGPAGDRRAIARGDQLGREDSNLRLADPESGDHVSNEESSIRR